MLQEVGRVLAAVAALIVATAGRIWRGMQWLVRHALAVRTATAQGGPRLGRLLDLATLSVAADLAMAGEFWRRGLPDGAGYAAVAGVLAAVALGFGVYLVPRHWTRLLWAGLTLLRIGAITLLVLTPPVIQVGGSSQSSDFVAGASLAVLVALTLLDRQAWALTTRTLVPPASRGPFIVGTLAYTAYNVAWAIGLTLLALILGGLWLLIVAEAVLLAIALIALTLPPPSVLSPEKPSLRGTLLPTQAGPRPAPPTIVVPPPPTTVTPPPVQAPPPAVRSSAEPEGYTVYRPSTLDE